MADVAFVPERHVFQRDDSVAANHARQSAQSFASDRISLVRHGGASLLSFAKKFFHLQHFRALQMPELGRPTIDARRNQRERGQKFGVPIALHDLRRKRRGLETEFLANRSFNRRIEMRMSADRAA